ncbi:hypothetical protein ACFVUW_30045 [Streptomyces xiamenensis]|uniref:hypothetical protein n=1 Tax=Streptomyces xiamenensis TaxID=408015 RepID=UPI0036EAC26A
MSEHEQQVGPAVEQEQEYDQEQEAGLPRGAWRQVRYVITDGWRGDLARWRALRLGPTVLVPARWAVRVGTPVAACLLCTARVGVPALIRRQYAGLAGWVTGVPAQPAKPAKKGEKTVLRSEGTQGQDQDEDSDGQVEDEDQDDGQVEEKDPKKGPKKAGEKGKKAVPARGMREQAAHLAALGIAGWLIAQAAIRWPLLGVGAGVWWWVSAWRLTRPDEDTAPADGGQKEKAGAPAGLLEAVTDSQFVEAVRAVIGAGPAVHLGPLSEALTAAWKRPVSTDDVKALARRAGVRTKPTRAPGADGVTTGIRGEDLPSPPPTPTPGGVVDAGQPSNNNSNNSPEGVSEEGLRVVRSEAMTITYPATETAARRHSVPRTTAR